jgi:hypothetical protein
MEAKRPRKALPELKWIVFSGSIPVHKLYGKQPGYSELSMTACSNSFSTCILVVCWLVKSFSKELLDDRKLKFAS